MSRETKGYSLFPASVTDRLIVAITAVFLAVGIVALKAAHPEYFELEFSLYALVPAVASMLFLGLLGVLFVRRGFYQARLWLSIELVGGLLLCISTTMVRLSVLPVQVVFWSHMAAIGLAFIPLGFYMFVYFYVKDNNGSGDTVTPLSLVVGGGLLLAMSLGNQPTEIVDKAAGFWGYAIPLSTNFALLVVWLGFVISICIFKLIRYKNKCESEIQRRQASLIITGAIITVVGGILFDTLPKIIGINIFPVGVAFQLVLPAMIIYSIYKYDTFSVDLSSNADEILNTLSEAVIVTSPSFKILSINEYSKELLGYGDDELIGRPLIRLFDPKQFRSIINRVKHAPADGSSSVFNEIEIAGAQGMSYVNIAISELKADAQVYVFVMTNVTEMKRFVDSETVRNGELEAANQAFSEQQRAIMNLLEDSQDLGEQLRLEKLDVEKKVELRTLEVQAERTRLEASINSLNIGILVIDTNKRTISANTAIGQVIGLSSKEKSLDASSVHSQLKKSINIQLAIENCLKKGKVTTKDAVQYGEKVLRIFIAPVFADTKSKESLGAVILIEDISEVKAAERSRDEFFSIASHELRTPLTAIRGNTRMILDYYKADLKDPMLVEMVDDIHDSSIRLITIVNDFLDTSRLEQGKISFEITSFDSAALVEQIAQEFKAGAVNPDLYIKIDAPKKLPFITADHDRLKQTIINMVGNALKFTEKGGVTVRLRATEKLMIIEVEDSGKGIPLESQNLLFRKFQQASNNILTRDSTRSTGLGLYISKLMMQGMGGKIYLKSSKVGVGSVFALEIPISKTETGPKL